MGLQRSLRGLQLLANTLNTSRAAASGSGSCLSYIQSFPANASNSDSQPSSSGSNFSWPSAAKHDAVMGSSGGRLYSTQASHRVPAKDGILSEGPQSVGAADAAPSTQGSFAVEVTLKAFEERYLKAASTVIQDLVMLNFAPKARSVLPTDVTRSAPLPCGVALGAEEEKVNVNWKKTRFTVIRGPHIDKTGMEQFELRQYKTILRASTNSADEVHWLLEHLKMYEFTGVQLQVTVHSCNYLLPSAPPASLEQGVLAKHRKAISRHIRPSTIASTAEQRDKDLRSALDKLRGTVYSGLEARRAAIKYSRSYQDWHYKNRSKPHNHLSPEDAAAHNREGSAPLQLQDEGRRHAAAFLAAADAALLSLRFDVLERHNNFPYHIATFVPGTGSVPAAEWMQLVLKYAQYEQQMSRMAQEQQILQAYSSYSVFAHTLLYTLFKIWVQQTVSEMKPYLALPPAEESERFMKEVAPHLLGGTKPAARGKEGLFSKA
mmetsp:Transcript_24202/g.52890  ORF Transcript_24202/g.52890 Transcript_24202/m.52890 type:complete len:490 (+) Transcript_24202:84-1553(+)|eukprot:CAMPEP_0202898982 /NCGR_PEP_ID=MMETSP1392-20130828/7352_1 /ASSEMBLY_ACC=CAM_ASM_000868 /TAXON_ID=225041 /ORGANISM="Chlamydomonas chlamydogama, Strain SAG 11-48b" /LENGTH=489 /DNA_ID=CAMNT_0049585061 /DNA_START=45 /DNA_END=1514 /DNA_ORIENTATION=+